MVATSIGEEGLDIGEIDLIVCYEASKSPIRMVGLSPNSLLRTRLTVSIFYTSCNELVVLVERETGRLLFS
jgi:hypothetical protein